jgi:hypothetical protein
MSAKEEPTPPAMQPIIGPNIKPVIMTPASPILMNPWVAGIGIEIIIVKIQIKAEKIPIIEMTNVLLGKKYPLKAFHVDIGFSFKMHITINYVIFKMMKLNIY